MDDRGTAGDEADVPPALAERCRTRIDKYLRESVLIELLNELLKLT